MEKRDLFVEERVTRAAVRLAPYGNVDKSGRDQDDYAQILRERLWLNWDQITVDDKWERWTTKVIANKTKTLKRGLARQSKYQSYQDAVELAQVPGIESYVISKTLLSRLRLMIDSGDWELLVAWTEHDFNMRAAWLAGDRAECYGTYRRRVQNLLERCRIILQTF